MDPPQQQAQQQQQMGAQPFPFPQQQYSNPGQSAPAQVPMQQAQAQAQAHAHQLSYAHLQQQQQQQLHSFWHGQLNDIEAVTDFKNHQLPLARIKKIMKADEDVRMISAEAPVLFAKACEMFILELTLRSWIHTEENKRRTLQKNDIAAAIGRTEIFDFLVDIVPRDELKEEGGVGVGVGVGVGAGVGMGMGMGMGMGVGVGMPPGMPRIGMPMPGPDGGPYYHGLGSPVGVPMMVGRPAMQMDPMGYSAQRPPVGYMPQQMWPPQQQPHQQQQQQPHLQHQHQPHQQHQQQPPDSPGAGSGGMPPS